MRVVDAPGITGILDTADATSMAISVGDGSTVVLWQENVLAVDVVESKRNSRIKGILLGAAAGLAVAGVSGLFGEEDLVTSAKILYASGFMVGGGLIGAWIGGKDVQETHRRIYESEEAVRIPRQD